MNTRKIESYTEEDFLAFVARICICDFKSEREDNQAVLEFIRLAEHPSGSDLIFFPNSPKLDTPEGIVAELKIWRAANGLPGFKPPSN